MVTYEQFYAAAESLSEHFTNFTSDVIAKWYPHFKDLGIEVFRVMVAEAPEHIAFLTVKDMYELAVQLHNELFERCQHVASNDYELHHMMKGWEVPQRGDVTKYLPDDHPAKIAQKEKMALMAYYYDDPDLLPEGQQPIGAIES